MKRSRTICIAMMTVALPAASWGQRAVLKGTVSDPCKNAAVAGAHVTVSAAANEIRGRAITAADGSYEIGGLQPGDNVTVDYRRLGYRPDPWKMPVLLKPAENRIDVQLLSDTNDPQYWNCYATRVAAAADGRGLQGEDRQKLMVQSWTALQASGFSPEIWSVAAKQIVAVSPEARSANPMLSAFAAADPSDVKAAETALHEAFVTGADIPAKRVSDEVALALAMTELSKEPSDGEKAQAFARNFGKVLAPASAFRLQVYAQGPHREVMAMKDLDAMKEIQKIR
jgi:hypothetical protein